MMLKRSLFAAIVGASLAMAAQSAMAADISGAGSTFAYPIYAKWAAAYKTKTGIGMNYQSIGSGGGIKQIKAKTVDFGASDMPLKIQDLDAAGLIQFPMVMGGVVPVVNLPGIKPGEVKLDGKTLAEIYLGKITKWDDAAIAKLNPHVKLPGSKINVVHRSDASGTTYIFTHYLSQVDPTWKTKVGVNTSVQWPTGVGGKGNEGVSNFAKQIKSSIGYVEYAYALQNHMSYVLMENKAGHFVAPNSETFQAAAANAKWQDAPGFNLMLTDQPGAKSWPITGATFVLIYKVQDKPANGEAVMKFFDWAYHHGSKMAESIDYVPMPPNLVSLVEHTFMKEVKDKAGKSLFTAASVQK